MRTAEIAALVGLCFFLPIYEAPKSIFCVLYLAIWLVNRVRARDFGGPWDRWDTLIAAWIGSGFVVAAFAGVRGGDEWRGALDLLRYGTVLWLAKRSRFSSRELAWVLGALVASTLVGLAMAYAALLQRPAGVPDYAGLQLNSVGHVNHTAIYLAIMLGVSVAWLVATWRRSTRAMRAVGIAATLLILAGLITTASRGAIGAAFLMLLVIAAAWWPRSHKPLFVMLAALGVVVIGMLAGGANVVQKLETSLGNDNLFAYRLDIWKLAVAAWEKYPVFGVGMDNFGQVTPYKTRPPRELARQDQPRERALEAAHAHSLYLNTLAERGVVGSLALGAVLLAWLFSLVRGWPPRDEEAWILWGGAASAWLITVIVGAVNTTLHHEHGILAALLLGLWLSRAPKR